MPLAPGHEESAATASSSLSCPRTRLVPLLLGVCMQVRLQAVAGSASVLIAAHTAPPHPSSIAAP